MNWIDLGILLVLGLLVLFGLYKGFVKTVAGLVSLVLAWVIAVSCYPLLAGALKRNDSIMNTVQYYIEDTSRLKDDVNLPIDSFQTKEDIVQAVEGFSIPRPLDDLLEKNISKQSFLHLNLTTVGEYLNQTVTNFAINLLSFLILFVIVRVLCAIILRAVDYAMKLPILTQMNSLLGGVFGLLVGVVILYLIFSLLPLFFMAVPSPAIEEMVEKSFLAQIFTRGNIISGLLRGV